jgi:hypothetical protein
MATLSIGSIALTACTLMIRNSRVVDSSPESVINQFRDHNSNELLLFFETIISTSPKVDNCVLRSWALYRK